MNQRTNEILEHPSIPAIVLKNVIPSIISMIMVLLYNLADTFFIGQTNNPLMVAAVSLGTPLFLLFMAVGLLFGIGGTSLISRRIGEGNYQEAKHISAFCFWTGITIGTVSAVLIWIFLDPLCMMVGATPDTVLYVKQYLGIVASSIPFLIVSNAFSSIIRAEGKANVAMMGMIAGNITNIVLDPVFILLFQMGVGGAAVATVLGNLVAALFYIFYILKSNSLLSIRVRDYTLGHHIPQNVLAIGVPASINSILLSVSNMIVNNFMTQYGDMAVAGLGVAMKVNMIAVMLLIGLGTGVQPVLGVCYGAGNKKRFQSVLRFSAVLAAALSLLMTVICFTCARTMVNTFLENPDASGFGMSFSRILILSGPVLGQLFLLTNAIQAMGAASQALILSISRQGIIYLPVLFTFNRVFHSSRTLVAAQPVADYLSCALALVLYLIAFKSCFSKK